MIWTWLPDVLMLTEYKLAFAMGVGLMAAFVTPVQARMATELDLRNMAARVIIVTETNRKDIDLKVAYGSAVMPKIMVRTDGDTIKADGGLKSKTIRCSGGSGGQEVSFGTMGNPKVAIKDLPVVYVQAPKDMVINAYGGLYGEVSSLDRLELSVAGCGAWHVGHITDTADISIGGSGDVTIGNAKSVSIAIGGSGNVRTGAVDNLEAAIGGNGDITVLRINGPAELAIAGSGNVRVIDGYAPTLDLSIAGSGKVHYGGIVRDVDINIVGSGNVYLKKVTGEVQRSVLGSGNIHIGP